MNLSHQEIISALGSELMEVLDFKPQKNASVADPSPWTEWTTDSRVTMNQGLFIALQGDKFDAHDFLHQAYQNGASGFVVENVKLQVLKLQNDFKERSPCIYYGVKNTVTALQKLAAASAAKLTLKKIAITGTSGKTSAKYFCHQILEGFVPHYFSPKSFNNHIGVPMTLLDFKPEHQVGLIEIGMNHPGEIAHLVALAQPDVCVVTMVGRGHLEGVGTIENVLIEKMSLYQQGHTHIINMDDPLIFKDYQKKFRENLNSKTFKILKISAKDQSADVYFKIQKASFNDFIIEGHIQGEPGLAEIAIAGEHHVHNIALAAAMALTAGMNPKDIWQQLKILKPVWGRSEILKTKNAITIYFDAYNANPESMKAFLKQTQLLATAPYFVLGEMLEMGEQASQLHFELGQLVAQTAHKKVWFIGPSSGAFKAGYEGLKNPENLIISNTYEQSLALKYQSMLQPKDCVALKASRGIGLEKFLQDFI